MFVHVLMFTAMAKAHSGCDGDTETHHQTAECAAVKAYLNASGTKVALCTGTREDIRDAISGVDGDVTGPPMSSPLIVKNITLTSNTDNKTEYCDNDDDGDCKEIVQVEAPADLSGLVVGDMVIKAGTFFRSTRITYGFSTPCDHPLSIHWPSPSFIAEMGSGRGPTISTPDCDKTNTTRMQILRIGLYTPNSLVLKCANHALMSKLLLHINDYTLGVGSYPADEYNGVPITAAVLCPKLCNSCDATADPTILSTYEVSAPKTTLGSAVGECNATVVNLLEQRMLANVTKEWWGKFGNFGNASVNATCRVGKGGRARRADNMSKPLFYTVVVKLPSVAASGGDALLRGMAIGLDNSPVVTHDIEAIANVTPSTFRSSIPAPTTTASRVSTRSRTTPSSTAESDDSAVIIAIVAASVAVAGTAMVVLCVKQPLRARMWNFFTCGKTKSSSDTLLEY